MTTDQLLHFLLHDATHPLAEPLAAWLDNSPRFAAFAATYRDKIRKKVRNARDAESARDLLLELETAYLLLRERRFTVAYEAYSATKTRGPDFAVTFTTALTFSVEVTRMRAANATVDQQSVNNRFGETVCSKLGQMLPNMPNVVVVVAAGTTIAQLDTGAAMLLLKQRAEQRDQRLSAWYGFRSPSDFVKQFERLSVVLLRSAWDDLAPTPPQLWLNRQAKHPLPERIRAILQR